MKLQENDFYIGIDIGAYSTVISYMDQHTGLPVILDPSGGFGQSSILSYMAQDEYGEWLVGDEAIEIDGAMPIDCTILEDVDLFKTYIEIVVEAVFQVNPKSRIIGIALSTAAGEDALLENQLREALMKQATFNQLKTFRLINGEDGMVEFLRNQGAKDHTFPVVIDFGHTGFRCYTISKNKAYIIDLLSQCEQLSGQKVLELLEAYFMEAYLTHRGETEPSEEVNHWISQLVKTYYPYIFKSYKEKKALKVTYNFAFPPFQLKVDSQTLTRLIEPFEERLLVLMGAFKSEEQIQTLAIIGNGLRMDWPVQRLQDEGYQVDYKDSDAYAKGAALIAMHSKWQKNTVYSGVLTSDYGLVDANDQFVLLGKRGKRYKDRFEELLLTMHAKEKTLLLYKRIDRDQHELINEVKIPVEDTEEIYNISVRLLFDDDQKPDLSVRHLPL